MNDVLTLDEYAALAEIRQLPKGKRPSACVARNTKRLADMKHIRVDKSGHPELTVQGQQTLFIKQCVDGLRKLSENPQAQVDNGVSTFLEKKGHVQRLADSGHLVLTERGRETLADIDRSNT